VRSTTPGAALTAVAGTSTGGCLSRQRDPLPTRVTGLPGLPLAYDEALDAGLAALGLELEPVARAAIDDHVRLLVAWNAAINLTAVREPVEIARRHVVDSLAGVPLLRSRGIREIVDLGSGGGFPGIPLAIVLRADRGLLVESVAKKARFLEAAVDVAGLAGRVTVAAKRAEALADDPGHRNRWAGVTARAVAPLAELLELAMPLLVVGGSLVAWKGAALESELAAAGRAAGHLGAAPPEVVEAPVPGGSGHRLVVIRKVAQTPPGYPREPAGRRRRPW
jgi:16S rRNA (guanine527-N7)-methyltransferase